MASTASVIDSSEVAGNRILASAIRNLFTSFPSGTEVPAGTAKADRSDSSPRASRRVRRHFIANEAVEGRKRRHVRWAGSSRSPTTSQLGLGTKQDWKAAFAWYNKAARKGDEQAAFNIGAAYEAGEGVRKNRKTALRWYRKAVELGAVARHICTRRAALDS